MPFYLDTYFFILVVPALIFSLYAQFRVKSVFNKYNRVVNTRGLTAADVARDILNRNGLENVQIERIPGNLNDHYDPRTRTVRLSDAVYASRSIAAIGVAAHETGHAMQHDTGYAPLAYRNSFVPIAGFGSGFGPYIALAGLIFGMPFLVQIGIILFTAAVAFTLITLPVEFNASSRAINTLENTGILGPEEVVPARKVLNAAAMTYVAAAVVAIMNLLRLVLLANRRND